MTCVTFQNLRCHFKYLVFRYKVTNLLITYGSCSFAKRFKSRSSMLTSLPTCSCYMPKFKCLSTRATCKHRNWKHSQCTIACEDEKTAEYIQLSEWQLETEKRLEETGANVQINCKPAHGKRVHFNLIFPKHSCPQETSLVQGASQGPIDSLQSLHIRQKIQSQNNNVLQTRRLAKHRHWTHSQCTNARERMKNLH